jgi:hypothetical protein
LAETVFYSCCNSANGTAFPLALDSHAVAKFFATHSLFVNTLDLPFDFEQLQCFIIDAAIVETIIADMLLDPFVKIKKN